MLGHWCVVFTGGSNATVQPTGHRKHAEAAGGA
jgi:hypothetical protein